jgi:hypothetical protein
MHYLAKWRMQVASEMLNRGNFNMATIAAEIIHLRSSVWGRSGLRFLMTFDSGVTVLVVWHAASSAGFFEVTSVAIAGPGATSFR